IPTPVSQTVKYSRFAELHGRPSSKNRSSMLPKAKIGRETKHGHRGLRPVERDSRSEKVPLSREIVKKKLRAKTTFTNCRTKHICHCGFRIAECGLKEGTAKSLVETN